MKFTLRNVSVFLLVLYAVITSYSVLSISVGAGYNLVLLPLSAITAFSFAVLHGVQRLGWKALLLLLVSTVVISLAFESIGVATGAIYGSYHYTDKLGPKFLDLVPYLIPVAWFMVSYPAFILAVRLVPARSNVWVWRILVAAAGAAAMTAWDLAMDPMMVAGGHWIWDQAGEYFDIPVQNFWGWWLTIFVAFLFFLAVGRVKPEQVRIQDHSDHSFDQLAILSYGLAGLSSIVMDFQIDLAGPGMVGIFAMAPWAVLGWFARHDP